MTKLTNSPVVKRKGSVATKKDGTQVKTISMKLAMEDYTFVTDTLGQGMTDYVREKIEEDKHVMKAKTPLGENLSLRASAARETYMRNRFYNDIYDRLVVMRLDWYDDQDIRLKHINVALIELEKLMKVEKPKTDEVPQWEHYYQMLKAEPTSWFDCVTQSQKDTKNSLDVLYELINFFRKVQPTYGEVTKWLADFRRKMGFDKLDTFKPSEDGAARLDGRIIERDDPNRFTGFEDPNEKLPWEE